ncbi:hypothetical protein ACFYXD_34980 [Streptomyces platensis]|uniref:hypothetical protein n=1 Tax=Streptomyces platensis TaxID=58346 RepID=UPI003682A4B1
MPEQMARLSIDHVEYLLAEEIGADEVTWNAELIGLSGWDGSDFAMLAVVRDGEPWTYLSDDIDYVRMLDQAGTDGIPVELTHDIAAAKLPINRPGWPSEWMLQAATQQ